MRRGTSGAIRRIGRPARCHAISPSGSMDTPVKSIWASGVIDPATDVGPAGAFADIMMNAREHSEGRSEQTLAAAMAHHRAGRLADAERLYRVACDADPTNARAFHLLGLVAHQLVCPDAASLLSREVTLYPESAYAHNDRSVSFSSNGPLP